MDKHTIHYELLEALGGVGCPICTLVRRGLDRYFDLLMYERVNDIRTRASIRAALGFCAAHGRMLRDHRAPLGSAIIQRDLIKTLGDVLGAAPRQGTGGVAAALRQVARGGRRGGPLQPQQECPACERRADVEQTYIGLLARQIGDAAFAEAMAASSGLCLPHLRLALRSAPDGDAFDRLRDAQRAAWSRLQHHLEEFIRKHDYRFSGEVVHDAEATSWAAAIDLVSGQPGLVPPDGD